MKQGVAVSESKIAKVILPDGSNVTVPLPDISSTVNVQLRTVVNGQIVSPGFAMAVLAAERTYWRDKAGRLESQLGDAKAELQQLRPSE